MNQMTKTMCFVGAAIASTVLAFASRSTPEKVDALTAGVAELCPDFNDPLAAKSLRIVRFDETLASLSEIEVKETGGIWTLPSHDDYPADAENRIRDATTPFIDLKSLSVQTDNDGEHAMFGVVEPSADKSAVGDQGVGTLVTVEDGGGNKLVNLIIGKEVKDNPELRYVRQPGRSRVYVVKIDPKNLPVKFEDWIDKDLLQLNAWDVQQLVLKDYTFQVAATLSGPVTDYDQRLEVTLTDDNGTWKLDEMLVAENDELRPTGLNEGEQLNADRLNEMKEALDGLEIVNVERKPTNLGADLRADKGFANDQAGIESLLRRGFYPVSMPGGGVEVLSAEGEVLCRTKEGVEYVLRFGGVEGVDTESEEGKLNRFLLVSARVNDNQFPEPALEQLPETVEELKQFEAAASETSTSSSEATSNEEPSDDDSSDAGATGEAASPTDESSSAVPSRRDQRLATLPTAALQASENEEQNDSASADSASVDASSNEDGAEAAAAAQDVATTNPEDSQTPAASPAAAPTTDGDAAADNASADQAPASDQVDWDAKLKVERERITKENQQKIDERNDKLGKARDKVRELNYRFADWYYVISEDVYKKIHLSQADIVEPIPAEGEAADTQNDGAPNLEGLQFTPPQAP